MIQMRAMSLMRGGKLLLENADITVFPGHHVGWLGAMARVNHRYLPCCGASYKPNKAVANCHRHGVLLA